MLLLAGMSIVPAAGDNVIEKHELSKARYLGRILHIPSEYPTIQSGIDNATNGDTVLVAPGTYTSEGNRDLDFHGKAITVTSEDGPEVTIIDCNANSSDRHRGFYFHYGEDSSSIVNGFTITNGYYDYGGGIYCCNYSSPTITNNTITDNSVYADGYNSYGAGIYCYNHSTPYITNNIITNNRASASGWGCLGKGGGISCHLYSNPTISNNTIEINTASDGGGIYCREHSNPTIINNNVAGCRSCGIYCCVYSNPNIINNTICDNFAGWGGGGIWCDEHCNPTITGNVIVGNTAYLYGGGIGVWGFSNPTINNNIISGNSAQELGGGIQCNYYSNPIISSNTIQSNYAYYQGGGISCSWDSSPLISNNTIKGNSVSGEGWYGGGIDCYLSSNPMIINNTISGNSAEKGGGISCDSDSSPTISNNVISRNSAVGGGGIRFDTYYKSTISNNTIGGNSAYYPETSSNPIISNNTISGNSARSGGGIHCCYSSPIITNTILWGDTAPNGEIYVYGGNPIVTYCNVQGGWPGEGNIDADPLFVLPDKKDYRLLWGSPCIDSGKPNWSDPDNTRSDMGAFFFDQDDYLTLYLSPHDNSVAPGCKLGVTYTLINRHNESERFDVLTEAVLPDGQVFNVLGPVRKRLPGNYTVQKEIPLKIPVGAPFELNVLYRSRIGLPPNRLYDEDSFSFTIDYPPYEPRHPSPGNGSIDVDVDTDLGWISGDPDPFDTVTYDVYLGTSVHPGQVAWNHTSSVFDPGTMNYNTTYWWRVVAWDDHGACTTGPLWWFKTGTSPYVVWVDDDFNETTPGWGITHFNNIQNGIGAVAYHGCVLVYNGTYFEHVVVDKNIDLFGEDKYGTVVDGSGDGNVVHINAGWVNISGFTICNSGSYEDGMVVRSDYNNISGNNIVNNRRYGIWMKYSYNNTIHGNNFTNNNDDGVLLEYSSNNIISKNTIINTGEECIHIIYSSNYNIISGNYMANNSDSGIVIKYSCENNIIYSNIIENNSGNGIYFSSSCNDNFIYHNNLINNTQNACDKAINIWNVSYPIGGNYWSDYTGDDNYHGPGQNLSGPDGIGDIPYLIPGGSNQDWYPFMNPNGWFLEKIIV